MEFGPKHYLTFCSLTTRRCVHVISRSTFRIFQIILLRFKKNQWKTRKNFDRKKSSKLEIFRKNEKSKNRKILRISIGNFRIFEFWNFRIFDFRKISIEILRKNFDFQKFRFSDFSKIFQLRRICSTKIYATFPLIFF